MFSPNDKGLKYPLRWKQYHGRVVILSDDGRELFLLEIIRPSREAKIWIEEWAQKICDQVKKENPIIHVPTLIDKMKKEDIAIEEKRPIELHKRGRGRPRKT